jgi:hypothetical protein
VGTPNVNFTSIENARVVDEEKNEVRSPPKLNNYSISEADKTNTSKMLSDVLGTELIIERCIRALEKDDTLSQTWPADAMHNSDLVKGLSYSKMMNEINH